MEKHNVSIEGGNVKVTQKPSVGRIVRLVTAEPINGQHDHAAIITQVWNDEMINVTAFPGSGAPMSIGSLYIEGHQFAKTNFWKWPPRE